MFHKIGAISLAKIVELCDAVIVGQRPEITVADLTENYLTEKQWQSSIYQDDLSLEFHATGHFTDTSPNTKTITEKFTFTTLQASLEKDMTNTIEHSLDVITSNMASLSAQMMYFGQSLTDRMGQLYLSVTGMQQDTDMLTNTLLAIKDQNKDVQNHLSDQENFWMTWRKY